MPPLRERGEDIALLTQAFLVHLGRRYGRTGLQLTPAAEQALQRYTWPGNVRELRNSIEHAVLLADEGVIDVGHLALCPALSSALPRDDSALIPGSDFPEEGIDLEKLEQRLIVQALRKTGWNVTRAAKLLSLSRDTLRYRMEKYRLSAEEN